MQTLNPNGYTPTTDYFLNVGEEAVNKIVDK
jgi:hypothetical protein